MTRPDARFGTFRDALGVVREAAPRTVLLSLGIDMVSAFANAVLLVIAGQILRLMDDGTTWGETLPYLTGAGIALGVTMTGTTLRNDVAKLAVEQLEAHTVKRVLRAAATVPFTSFDSPAFYDRLRRAYESGLQQAWAIVQSTLNLLKTIMDLVAIFAVLLFVAPALIAIAAIAYLPLWLVTAGNTKALYTFSWELTESDRRRHYIAELLSHREAAKEVRIFNLFPALGSRFDALWEDRLERVGRVVRGRAVRSIMANTVSSLVIAAALGFVVWMTVEGRLSLADAGVGVLAVRQLSSGVGRANVSVDALHRSATHLRDYRAFLAEAAQQEIDHEGLPAPTRVEEIRFIDVTFTYPGGAKPALENVNLSISAGEVTAVVGANGAGKSTLMMLLAGLYPPDSGRIEWDGIDVSTFATASYHQAIAPLFQDFARLHLTVEENVTLDDAGSENTRQRTQRSLSMAGAAGFVSALPKQEQTQLGRAFFAGEELSIGQWQRLALARALYREAPVVLLDEPASALDPIGESDLVKRLSEISDERCVIFVSHRFASVSQADRIIVIGDGRVVEDGSHAALLAANQTYALLYQAQAEQFAS